MICGRWAVSGLFNLTGVVCSYVGRGWIGAVGRLLRGGRLPVGGKLTLLAALVWEHGKSVGCGWRRVLKDGCGWCGTLAVTLTP